uniref:RNA-directed DNA polymerase, eukaryota n=1 Tax=Tanacetum cinerariifolium TaxID=118510 RepID=A0A699HGX2_TANCI|nr:RNA-directed DNA polymerase, eukaryota [Tanacetum cinerariifolium]
MVMLEDEVTNVEIKKVVWDCGSDKSMGLDGYTFEFIWKFWEIIGADVCRAIQIFFLSGRSPKGCNPFFVALIPKQNDAKVVKDYCLISLIGCQYNVSKILANRSSLVMSSLISKEQSAFVRDRQILDGPMILSEVIEWCNQKKKKSMIFKVDFEKAFDSVRFVLVNGNPTKEFQLQKGLRQGDPLSSFLFLLVMESLHLSFVRAMNIRFYKGIQVGDRESLNVSHLFYADDAVFIGEWKKENLRNLVCILQCFYLASGLRTNIKKCSLVGVGALVGSKMARIYSWGVVIDKVVAKLSKWEADTLSIGSRFTLIKSVLSSLPSCYFSLFKLPVGVLKRLEAIRNKKFRGVDFDSRKISWFSRDKVIASKDVGGLGMPSFFAMNHALLFKWIWRFKTQKDALWVLVIKSFHGVSGNLDRDIQVGKCSPWLDCIRSKEQLKTKGANLLSCITKKVGNGNDTSFWLENWMEGDVLKSKFSRLYALEENKKVTVF